jgi:hypothetical protein
LDAGAPYNRWVLGCGLCFYSEKKAEKIPIGFDSEEASQKWIKVEIWQMKFGLR